MPRSYERPICLLHSVADILLSVVAANIGEPYLSYPSIKVLSAEEIERLIRETLRDD